MSSLRRQPPSLMSIGRRSLVLLGVALVALVSEACVGGQIGRMGQMQPGMHGPQSEAGRAPASQQGADEILVIATEFAFEPDELRLVSGETVNLRLENRGDAFHDLTIGDVGFTLVADPNRHSTGSLRVDRPGRYEFICSVPGHAQAGMVGTLIVV
jgi:uncharacterized cupredoxin-like copper-binding protein